MPRYLTRSLLTLLILLGGWLSSSGVYSFCTARVGGMYVTTLDGCYFIPDINGWIARVLHAGIAISGLVLGWTGAAALFATMKLGQHCACGSGRNYRHCCFRRERGFLFVSVMTAITLFIFRALDGSIAPILAILVSAVLAFWLVGRHYRSETDAKRV